MAHVNFTFREVRQWPGVKRSLSQTKASPFRSNAPSIWRTLTNELAKLSAREVVISGWFAPGDFKKDGGGIYADARPAHPGIQLQFRTAKGVFRFQTDRYSAWVDNLYAIAKTLERLRIIDRDGVTSGEQYEGFRAIPEKTGDTMTTEVAKAVLAAAAGLESLEVRWGDAAATQTLVRMARSRTHPDRGGKLDEFQRVEQAIVALAAAGIA